MRESTAEAYHRGASHTAFSTIGGYHSANGV
jgi:hypothetical protein